MMENVLRIQIQKPRQVVFAFTIDPRNTHRWIQGIETEETNEWPICKGTVYRNRDREGVWTEYVVSLFVENESFELIAKDSPYHVRYSYEDAGDGATVMEYREWMTQGDLQKPFTDETMRRLKDILETKNP